MNIFVSSPSPVESAKFLDNKRIVKMVLETCQLLSTAVTVCGGSGPYKVTHINHPCSIWTRQSKGNYVWLVQHFEALLSEYTRRYGKVHKCNMYLAELKSGVDLIPDGPLLEFINCTTFKNIHDVHEAYKLCLTEKWKNDKLIPMWDVRGVK